MSFELSQRKHIDDAVTKIVRRELRKAVRILTTSGGSGFDDAVHESRKSVKKVRAVAALLQEAAQAPVPRKDRKRMKSAARDLSRIRDSAAIVETLEQVHRQYPARLPEHTYRILRRGLVEARNQQQGSARRDGIVRKAVTRLAKTRRSAKGWSPSAIDVADVVAVIAASYRRNRRAMQRAQVTGQSATLHRWRKEVKTLWYQLRLAQPLIAGIAPLVADLRRLGTELGNDHNLVVLVATLRGCRNLDSMRAEIRRVDRLAARMRATLRRRAFALGRRVYACRSKAFALGLRASSEQRSQQTAA